jgi:excisionase family DNA binding protein
VSQFQGEMVVYKLSSKRKPRSQPAATSVMPSTPQEVDAFEILTPEEVAARLKIKPSTVYELTRSRCRSPLPFHRAGKVLRFNWTEVVAWFMQQGTAR